MSPDWKTIHTAPATSPAHLRETWVDEFDTAIFHRPIHMWATQQDQYIDIDGGVTTFIEPVVIVDGYPVAAHLGIEFTERAVILREVADGPPPPDQEGRPRADWLWKKFCERKGIDYTPLAEVETR